jgi:hypothetical protein
VTKHPPTQGEHTREVLVELGFSVAEIDAMIATGLIADRAEMRRIRAARGASG